jgi:hypothetical protein
MSKHIRVQCVAPPDLAPDDIRDCLLETARGSNGQVPTPQAVAATDDGAGVSGRPTSISRPSEKEQCLVRRRLS